MTPFDRQLFLRTLGFSWVLLVMMAVISSTTDEAQSTWAMRAARWAVFAAPIGALAQLLSLAVARQRGETLALGALGAGPLGVAKGAMCAAWVVGLGGVTLLLSSVVDLRSLFPEVAPQEPWQITADAMRDAAHGISVSVHGHLEFVAAPSTTHGGTSLRPAALAAALPLALLLPLWAALPSSAFDRALGATASACLLIVGLHWVAAERIGGSWMALCALPLLWRRRASLRAPYP